MHLDTYKILHGQNHFKTIFKMFPTVQPVVRLLTCPYGNLSLAGYHYTQGTYLYTILTMVTVGFLCYTT